MPASRTGPRDGALVQLLAIVILGLGLAMAGVGEGVDSVVWFVFAIVDGVPDDLGSVLQPVLNPPPMNTYAHRPLSTLLLKLGSQAFGRSPEGLQLFTLVHGSLLVPYGLAARAFLIAHGQSTRRATLAALLCMLAPTVLFSAWTLPEFDMVGGAIVLWAGATLRRGRLGAALLPLALATLVKETTAVLMLAYLLALSAERWREGARRPLLPLGIFLGMLGLALAPILSAEPLVSHAFSLTDTRFGPQNIAWMAFHDLSQLFYSLGAVGSVLLAWLALARLDRLGPPPPGPARRRLPPAALPIGVFAASLAAPLLRHHNHFESIVFAAWPWVLGWGLLALAALAVLMVRGRPDERILAGAVLLALLGLLAGPLVMRVARADLSARLFAPVLPALTALVLGGIAQGLAGTRPARLAAGFAAACVAWTPAAGTISAWQETQARLQAELPAKEALGRALLPSCGLVFTTNKYHELYPDELVQRVGVPRAQLDCARIVRLNVTETGRGGFWDYPTGLLGFDQHRAFRDREGPGGLEDLLRRRQPLTQAVHLYVQGPRALFETRGRLPDHRAFAWAEGRIPDVDPGYFQQAVGMIDSPDTPLERVFEDAAPDIQRFSADYFQLPLHLGELPRRLLKGAPLIERYRYKATLYAIPLGQRPVGSPDPLNQPLQPGE